MSDSPAINALALAVRSMRDEVAALRDETAFLARRLLSTSDRRTGAALLPLIRTLMADRPFTAKQLTHEAFNNRSETGQALLELISEDITEIDRLNAFGKLLARLEGVRFAELRLERDGETGHVARWRVGVCKA